MKCHLTEGGEQVLRLPQTHRADLPEARTVNFNYAHLKIDNACERVTKSPRAGLHRALHPRCRSA
jgi:hypothetical protein